MQAVVLRVLEHRDAAAKPLDQVRDEIVTALRTRACPGGGPGRGQGPAGAAGGGGGPGGDRRQLHPESAGCRDPKRGQGPGGGARCRLHPAASGGGPGGDRPASGVATLPDGAALVVVSAVTDGDPAAIPEPARLQQGQSIARSIGSQALSAPGGGPGVACQGRAQAPGGGVEPGVTQGRRAGQARRLRVGAGCLAMDGRIPGLGLRGIPGRAAGIWALATARAARAHAAGPGTHAWRR